MLPVGRLCIAGAADIFRIMIRQEFDTNNGQDESHSICNLTTRTTSTLNTAPTHEQLENFLYVYIHICIESATAWRAGFLE